MTMRQMRQMRQDSRILVGSLGILLGGACASPTTEEPLAVEDNVCPSPQVREVRVSTCLDADWRDAVSWAFDRWREEVPGLLYHVTQVGTQMGQVMDQTEAEPKNLPCVTSFLAQDLADLHLGHLDVYGVTKNGYVLLARETPLTLTGKRSVTLHELGHLLFGFGESKDPSSIMHLPLNLPVLSPGDVVAARAAFDLRDGSPG